MKEMERFGEKNINGLMEHLNKLFPDANTEGINKFDSLTKNYKAINDFIESETKFNQLVANGELDIEIAKMILRAYDSAHITTLKNNLNDSELCEKIDVYKILEISKVHTTEENAAIVNLIKDNVDYEYAKKITTNSEIANKYKNFQNQGINNKYSAILANIKNIENYDAKEICKLLDSIKTQTYNGNINMADFLSKYLAKNPKINISELTDYINKIDFDKLGKIAPYVKTFEPDQFLTFSDYHFKNGGKTDFTAADLKWSTNFTSFLSENYLTESLLTDFITIKPLTTRGVGSIPKGWLDNVETNNKSSAINNIFYAIYDLQTNKDIEAFENKMSQTLGKSVTVKPLGHGFYGSGFKISMDGADDMCLKLFDQKKGTYSLNNNANLRNIHGEHIEVQTGLFANAHSTDFVKMYFGKVSPRNSNDGFLITQFLSENVTPENTTVKNSDKYIIKSYDVGEDHNFINGKIIDFGGVVVKKNK